MSPLPDALGGCELDRPLLERRVRLHVSPHGDDARDGSSLDDAVATLAQAQTLLPEPLDNDYEIVVHDGSDQPQLGGATPYRYQQTTWRAHSSDYRVVIRAAPDQAPVFDGRPSDGRGPSKSFALHIANPGEVINITVQGLTIRNYAQIGIWVYGSCNRLYANKTRDIGDLGAACVWRDDPPTGDPLEVFDRPECTSGWTSGSLPSGCECVGYAGILVMHGDYNLIKRNDVIDSLNVHSRDSHVHSIYLANGASSNRVEENYVRNVGGAPIKLSSGSNRTSVADNVATRNYLDRAGDGNFFHDDPKSGGPASPGTVLDRNVATFPTFLKRNVLAEPVESFVLLNGQQEGRFFQGIQLPLTEERVAAMVVADIGDEPGLDTTAHPELVVALSYPELGFSKVVYKDGGPHHDELRSVAFSSDEWLVTALAAGQFTDAPHSDVVMALSCVPGKPACSDGQPRTKILTGKMDDGVYGFEQGTVLYDVSGPTALRVTAMTAGRFGDDAVDSLVVAGQLDDVQLIVRGDGKSPQRGRVAAGIDHGTPLYSSTEWRVTALASGDLGEGGHSLLTALRATDTGTRRGRVELSDGVTTANARLLFDGEGAVPTGLAVGTIAGAARAMTVIDDGTTQSIYASDETLGDLLSRQLYTTPAWTISSITTGDVDFDPDDDELIAGFDVDEAERPRLTRITWGDGMTGFVGDLETGATNGGEFYRSALEYPY